MYNSHAFVSRSQIDKSFLCRLPVLKACRLLLKGKANVSRLTVQTTDNYLHQHQLYHRKIKGRGCHDSKE